MNSRFPATETTRNEQLLLAGLILTHGRDLARTRDFVFDADFLDSVHQDLFRAIVRLVASERPCDVISLKDAIEEDGGDFSAELMAYLGKSILDCPSSESRHMKTYAKYVQQASKDRQLRAAHAAAAEGIDVDIVGMLAEWDKREAQSESKETTDTRIANTMEIWGESYISEQKTGSVPCVTDTLDARLGGPITPGSLIVVGAKQGNGKTLFLMQSLCRAADAGHKCVIYSQEMSAEMIGERLFAMTHPDAADVSKGTLRAMIEDAKREFDHRDIWFRRVNGGATAIANDMRQQAEKGVAVFGIDYLQLLKPTNKKSYEAATEVSATIKRVNTELGTTTYLLSQLSREVMKENPPIPRMHHLRDSGRIEEDADVIFLLRYPKSDSKEKQIEASMKDENGQRKFQDLEWDELFEVYIPKVRNRELPSTKVALAMRTAPLRLERTYMAGEPMPQRVAAFDRYNDGEDF